MSKSLGNVVSPDDMVARYGADSTRMYTLFGGPPDRDLDWQDAGVEGHQRIPVARVPVRRAQCQAGRSGVERRAAAASCLRRRARCSASCTRPSSASPRFRRPLALQHFHLSPDGAGERAVRLRRQRAAWRRTSRAVVADGRRAAQAGADAGAVRAVSRPRAVGDAGRDLRPAARTLAAVRSRAGERRGSRDRASR